MQSNQSRFTLSPIGVQTLTRWAIAILLAAAGSLGSPAPALAQKAGSSGLAFSSYRVAIDFPDAPNYRLVVNGPSGGGWASFYTSTMDGGSDWSRELGTFGDASAILTVSGTKTTIASANLSSNLVAQDYDDYWYWDNNLGEWVQDFRLGAVHAVSINLTFRATGVVRKFTKDKYELHEMAVEGTVLLDGQPLRLPARTSIQAWYR